MSKLARIQVLATESSKIGTVFVKEGAVTAIVQYVYTDDLPELQVGDYVLGENYGTRFSVLYKANEPCSVIKIDFSNKRYCIETQDGNILGWFRLNRKEKKLWTSSHSA